MDPTKLRKKKGGGGASSGEHLTNVGDVIEALSQNDVLCGRGSGPNDHPGNVAFRQLILSRKAEYLSTSARAEKAKIASEIVAHVQKELDPSGRFLKKMGPAELREKGFREGQDVWVVVDQDTALEKAKQALRQNRDKPLVEEELKKKQAERHEEYAKLTEQATASLKSNSAETATTATTAGTGGSTTRKSVASVASSLSSGVEGQAKRMGDPSMTSSGSPQHLMDPYAASGGDPLAPHPFDYADPGTAAAEHVGAGTAHPGAPGHHGAGAYPNYGHPMPPSDDAYNNGQYSYHPQYGQQPGPPPPPSQHHQHHYPQQRGGRAGRGGKDVTQSLRVSDLVNDFHRLGPGDGEAGGEQKTGGPVAREQFPYAFGEAGQGSSNVTMNSVFSAVSESEIIAANIDPIPVGGSEPAIHGEVPGPMSSGTIDLVQQLTQSSGEGPDGANNTNEQQQNSRQQSFQQQQYQRHPGHQPDRQSYVQQYYYRSSMAQQQPSMRGSLRNAAVFGSNRSDMRSDMTMSMSLTELMKEPSGRNIAAYRQSVAAGDKGMQGIAEGEADDEGSDNDEDGGVSGEPMSGASAAAGSRSSSSSDKMSGMSSGSGMAASLASGGDNKPQALAVAPRPVELIQEEPDNLAFGASSSSMIKAVFDTSSGSNFSNLSRMSGILMSGDDELKPAAASDSEGKANT